MNLHCGECLIEHVDIVRLNPDGSCPCCVRQHKLPQLFTPRSRMHCGACLVPLVEGVCPKCGADYSATMDVFSIPMQKRKR